MGIMFGRTFLQDPEKADARARWRRHLLGLGRTGTARAAHGVIDRQGVYEQLGSITTPTLIVVGDEDIATVPARSERMHRAIPDSKLVVIPGAGHSSCIEQPDAVTRALQDFLPD
jgi:pimeloyl-ACP methyl ester carboxylesterase